MYNKLLIHAPLLLIFLLVSCASAKATQPSGQVFKINQDSYYENVKTPKKR